MERDWLNDQDWANFREQWSFPPGVTFLNHGAFGPSPRVVREAQTAWRDRLESDPCRFFLREMEAALSAARGRLADFLGAGIDDLAFVDNATVGMNAVAASVSLNPGDEVLLTDHEYGAMLRLWRAVCEQAGASVIQAELPRPFQDAEETAGAILQAVTPRTRLVVISHITSPTATILPVEIVCRRARELGVPVCIDGPHAIGMLDVNLRALDCDYYTASLHKWLSAPFGAGLLYVHPRAQETIQPAVRSWGHGTSGERHSWRDEFLWPGTRDPSPQLAAVAALDFLEPVGWDAFRSRTHALAKRARERLVEVTKMEPWTPEDRHWQGSMVAVPLPPGPRRELQDALWHEYAVQVPIVSWQEHRLIRVSCHLYNTDADLRRLCEGLTILLARERGS
ncbi:MAG: aminotransferase class V-fold PLP-dependent enzyme [Planctomycetales bacterium]